MKKSQLIQQLLLKEQNEQPSSENLFNKIIQPCKSHNILSNVQIKKDIAKNQEVENLNGKDFKKLETELNDLKNYIQNIGSQNVQKTSQEQKQILKVDNKKSKSIKKPESHSQKAKNLKKSEVKKNKNESQENKYENHPNKIVKKKKINEHESESDSSRSEILINNQNQILKNIIKQKNNSLVQKIANDHWDKIRKNEEKLMKQKLDFELKKKPWLQMKQMENIKKEIMKNNLDVPLQNILSNNQFLQRHNSHFIANDITNLIPKPSSGVKQIVPHLQLYQNQAQQKKDQQRSDSSSSMKKDFISGRKIQQDDIKLILSPSKSFQIKSQESNDENKETRIMNINTAQHFAAKRSLSLAQDQNQQKIPQASNEEKKQIKKNENENFIVTFSKNIQAKTIQGKQKVDQENKEIPKLDIQKRKYVQFKLSESQKRKSRTPDPQNSLQKYQPSKILNFMRNIGGQSYYYKSYSPNNNSNFNSARNMCNAQHDLSNLISGQQESFSYKSQMKKKNNLSEKNSSPKRNYKKTNISSSCSQDAKLRVDQLVRINIRKNKEIEEQMNQERLFDEIQYENRKEKLKKQNEQIRLINEQKALKFQQKIIELSNQSKSPNFSNKKQHSSTERKQSPKLEMRKNLIQKYSIDLMKNSRPPLASNRSSQRKLNRIQNKIESTDKNAMQEKDIISENNYAISIENQKEKKRFKDQVNIQKDQKKQYYTIETSIGGNLSSDIERNNKNQDIFHNIDKYDKEEPFKKHKNVQDIIEKQKQRRKENEVARRLQQQLERNRIHQNLKKLENDILKIKGKYPQQIDEDDKQKIQNHKQYSVEKRSKSAKREDRQPMIIKQQKRSRSPEKQSISHLVKAEKNFKNKYKRSSSIKSCKHSQKQMDSKSKMKKYHSTEKKSQSPQDKQNLNFQTRKQIEQIIKNQEKILEIQNQNKVDGSDKKKHMKQKTKANKKESPIKNKVRYFLNYDVYYQKQKSSIERKYLHALALNLLSLSDKKRKNQKKQKKTKTDESQSDNIISIDQVKQISSILKQDQDKNNNEQNHLKKQIEQKKVVISENESSSFQDDTNDYQLKRDSSKSISVHHRSDRKNENQEKKSFSIKEMMKQKRESIENNYDLPIGQYKKKDEFQNLLPSEIFRDKKSSYIHGFLNQQAANESNRNHLEVNMKQSEQKSSHQSSQNIRAFNSNLNTITQRQNEKMIFENSETQNQQNRQLDKYQNSKNLSMASHSELLQPINNTERTSQQYLNVRFDHQDKKDKRKNRNLISRQNSNNSQQIKKQILRLLSDDNQKGLQIISSMVDAAVKIQKWFRKKKLSNDSEKIKKLPQKFLKQFYENKIIARRQNMQNLEIQNFSRENFNSDLQILDSSQKSPSVDVNIQSTFNENQEQDSDSILILQNGTPEIKKASQRNEIPFAQIQNLIKNKFIIQSNESQISLIHKNETEEKANDSNNQHKDSLIIHHYHNKASSSIVSSIEQEQTYKIKNKESSDFNLANKYSIYEIKNEKLFETSMRSYQQFLEQNQIKQLADQYQEQQQINQMDSSSDSSSLSSNFDMRQFEINSLQELIKSEEENLNINETEQQINSDGQSVNQMISMQSQNDKEKVIMIQNQIQGPTEQNIKEDYQQRDLKKSNSYKQKQRRDLYKKRFEEKSFKEDIQNNSSFKNRNSQASSQLQKSLHQKLNSNQDIMKAQYEELSSGENPYLDHEKIDIDVQSDNEMEIKDILQDDFLERKQQELSQNSLDSTQKKQNKSSRSSILENSFFKDSQFNQDINSEKSQTQIQLNDDYISENEKSELKDDQSFKKSESQNDILELIDPSKKISSDISLKSDQQIQQEIKNPDQFDQIIEGQKSQSLKDENNQDEMMLLNIEQLIYQEMQELRKLNENSNSKKSKLIEKSNENQSQNLNEKFTNNNNSENSKQLFNDMSEFVNKSDFQKNCNQNLSFNKTQPIKLFAIQKELSGTVPLKNKNSENQLLSQTQNIQSNKKFSRKRIFNEPFNNDTFKQIQDSQSQKSKNQNLIQETLEIIENVNEKINSNDDHKSDNINNLQRKQKSLLSSNSHETDKFNEKEEQSKSKSGSPSVLRESYEEIDKKRQLGEEIEKHYQKKIFDEDVHYLLKNVVNRESNVDKIENEENKFSEVPEQISLKQAELQRELSELQKQAQGIAPEEQNDAHQKNNQHLIAGIDTSIETVESYIDDIFAQIRQRGPQFLNAFLTPIYRDPLEQLQILKQAQIEYLLNGTFGKIGCELIEPQSLNQSMLCILNVQLYLTLEKERESVIKEAIEQIKQQSEEEINEEELAEMISEADHIHNKAIFDCVNEAMNLVRPYGIQGEPMPWSSLNRKSSHLALENKSVFQTLDKVLNKVKNQVLYWSSIRAGAINTFQIIDNKKSGNNAQVQINQLIHEQERSQGIEQIIHDEIDQAYKQGYEYHLKNYQQWSEPGENFSSQIQLEMADYIFDFLVQDTVNTLQTIEQKKNKFV